MSQPDTDEFAAIAKARAKGIDILNKARAGRARCATSIAAITKSCDDLKKQLRVFESLSSDFQATEDSSIENLANLERLARGDLT